MRARGWRAARTPDGRAGLDRFRGESRPAHFRRSCRTLTLLLASALLTACGEEDLAPPDDTLSEVASRTLPSPRAEAILEGDWKALETKLRWAYGRRIDTLPIGQAMVEIGRSLVGTPYLPHTLEIPGEERLVLNFEALDCVTYVENVLALARTVLGAPPDIVDDPPRYRQRYADELRRIRYRNGRIDGYGSRLHYFSEWIVDGERKRLVHDVGEELGGVPDRTRIDFMSRHRDAYRQLSEAGELDRIRAAERRLSTQARYYLPEGRIAAVSDEIQDGDIIAATSAVEGLDVAHTGIAIRIDGALHLMHAPLVGEAVQISERTLADRILAIGGQDGVMVARPIETEGGR